MSALAAFVGAIITAVLSWLSNQKKESERDRAQAELETAKDAVRAERYRADHAGKPNGLRVVEGAPAIRHPAPGAPRDSVE